MIEKWKKFLKKKLNLPEFEIEVVEARPLSVPDLVKRNQALEYALEVYREKVLNVIYKVQDLEELLTNPNFSDDYVDGWHDATGYICGEIADCLDLNDDLDDEEFGV